MLTLGKPSKPIFLVNHWETFHKKKCGNKTPHQTHPPLPPSSHAPCVHYACVLTIWTSSGHPPPIRKYQGSLSQIFFNLDWEEVPNCRPLVTPPPWHDPFCTCTPVQPSLLCTVLYYCTVVLCTSVQRVRDQLWSVSLDNGSQTLS